MSMVACTGGGSFTCPINELPEASNLTQAAIRIILAIGPHPEALQFQRSTESTLLPN